mgnify:CR=1 FL=1
MPDAYNDGDSALASAKRLRAVTPHDTNELALGASKALHIGAAGTITLIALGDTDAVQLTVAQGILPIRAKVVKSTGTTATSIVALY